MGRPGGATERRGPQRAVGARARPGRVGRWFRSNSLDNTIRLVRPVATEWVLLDIRVHAVRDGFGHGLVHLWSGDGVLMATASQSAIVRDEAPS